MKERTLRYKGADLPLNSPFIDSRGVRQYRADSLVELREPPSRMSGSDTHWICYGTYSPDELYCLYNKSVDYVVQIGDKYYLPKIDHALCHINLMVAKYSKLGKAL